MITAGESFWRAKLCCNPGLGPGMEELDGLIFRRRRVDGINLYPVPEPKAAAPHCSPEQWDGGDVTDIIHPVTSSLPSAYRSNNV